MEKKYFKCLDQTLVLVIFPSIVLPFLLTWGGAFLSSRAETSKRKMELLREFAQDYSSFLSFTEESFYISCVNHGNTPIQREECKTYQNIESRRDCERMQLKKLALNVKQPDGLLIQIQVFFDDKSTKATAEKLLGLTNFLADSLACKGESTEIIGIFESKLSEADNVYKELLRQMALAI